MTTADLNQALCAGERAAVSDNVLPEVPLPRNGISNTALAMVAVAFGVGLFLLLNSNREAQQSASSTFAKVRGTLIEPAPELVLPPTVLSAAPLALQSSAPAQARSGDVYLERVAPFQAAAGMPPSFSSPPSAPRQVFAGTIPSPSGSGEGSISQRSGGGNNQSALLLDFTAGKQVEQSADSGSETATATVIRKRGLIVPQGTMIAAVLETPLNSDRPGLTRAIVSSDVRGFDGTLVLIPRGSRLIGSTKFEQGPGKRRVLISWDRLIRSDGVAVKLSSPATDRMGGAGVPGTVNTHFAEKLFGAVLQTALNVGSNVAVGRLTRSGNNVFVGVPGSVASVGQDLVPNPNRSATVKVREGAEISVLVARDLDFSGTPTVR